MNRETGKHTLTQDGVARTQFLYTMSHEIRTPLNAMLNTIHFLLESDPREDQAEHLGILRFSAETVIQLINQVLDYAKIDAGKIEFVQTHFEVAGLVKQICHSLESEASRKGLKISCQVAPEVPEVVIGDRSRLAQIIMNLAGNAIKFTEAGVINLTVSRKSSRDGLQELLFVVSDTGIGIPADQIDRIFERFTQLGTDIEPGKTGAGLGLAISRKLVEHQGGTMQVESTPGQGSIFSFTLPFRDGNKSELPSTPASFDYHSLKGKKILVAEDNEVNRRIVEKLLSGWEAEAESAENGRIAVSKASKNKYDLVLMDVHMPDMNGYEATQAIRNLDGKYYRDLPILALTATAFTEDRDKFLSSGMNGYIIKPFTPPELFEKISSYLNDQHSNAT